jgi:hypothetical protein
MFPAVRDKGKKLTNTECRKAAAVCCIHQAPTWQLFGSIRPSGIASSAVLVVVASTPTLATSSTVIAVIAIIVKVSVASVVLEVFGDL